MAKAIQDVQALLLGLPCSVTRYDNSWSFAFGDTCNLVVSCPWRMLRGTVALADADDRQQYGLPEAVDAESRANILLRGARVRRFELVEASADVKAWFDNGVQLETFTDSIGYESWQANFQTGGLKLIVGMGGGGVTVF